MCGRYYLAVTLKDLVKRYGAVDFGIDFQPRYNIAPTQTVPVVINNGGNQVRLFRWGFIPFWAKDMAVGNKMINARAETITSKLSFKEAFKERRCIVPASGFYEWDKSNKKKIPFKFYSSTSEILSLAGLWDVWRNKNGEVIYSFTIITTKANKILKPYHHRMAVILEKECEETWLDKDNQSEELLLSLLKPYPSEKLKKDRVSEKVNNVRNDFPELIYPLRQNEQLRIEI